MTSKAFANATDVNRQQAGRRNLIINGAMQVAQRGNTTNDNGVFVADRFAFQTNGLGGAGAVIAASTQSTVVPSGFASALKTNVTTAGSGFAADNRDGFSHKLEHQDVTHLVDAGNSFTVSFWCRSSLATTYGFTVWLGNRDTTSGGNVYATTYTINTADTWEYKTISIPAVSSSRSGGTDNLRGMQLYWALELISGGTRGSATADSWSDSDTSDQVTAAATDTGWMSSINDFYITGVQLEVGDVATPFEHRSFGEELALCQRYCYTNNINSTTDIADNRLYSSGYLTGSMVHIDLPVTLRDAPNSISYTAVGGAVDSTFEGPQRISLYDASDTSWRLFNFVADAEL